MTQLIFADLTTGIDLGGLDTPRGMEAAAVEFHSRKHNPKTIERLALLRERYSDNPRAYIDGHLDVYLAVLDRLPDLAKELLFEICRSYRQGIRMGDLAVATFTTPQTCSAIVGRMASLGLVSITRMGRESIVRQADEDFLRFFALRFDYKFDPYFRSLTNEHDRNHSVDLFIKERSAMLAERMR